MSSTEAPRNLRFLLAPRWLGWHVLVVASVIGMLALGNWQLHRAEAGNSLSWAYTFEWPIFAGFAIVFWAKTIRDEIRPPGPDGGAGEGVTLPGTAGRPAMAADGQMAADDEGDDEELASYNAYLARLHKEVKGHGRWHGLR